MRKNVLFVCDGSQHLPKSLFLAKCLKDRGITSYLFHAQPLTSKADAEAFLHTTSDLLAIPGLLKSVGLVVFFTHESSPFCLKSTKIGFIAKKTGTPTVTIQHGWIQPGLNFSTDCANIAFLGRETDNSRAIWHFSDVLEFFGEDGIGYPTKSVPNPQGFTLPIDGKVNVLLATNFNWGVYSRESIVSFLRSVVALKQTFPSFNIIHKPHPAEKSQQITSEMGFYFDITGVEQGKWTSIDDALTWSDLVISTPSTVVLDAHFRNIPVFVYECEVFKPFLKDHASIAFDSPNRLIELISSLVTENKYSAASFVPFNHSKFIAEIDKRLSNALEFDLDEEGYLQYLMYSKI